MRGAAKLLIPTLFLLAWGCSAPGTGDITDDIAMNSSSNNNGVDGCGCGGSDVCVQGECVPVTSTFGSYSYGLEIYDLRPYSKTQGQVIYDVAPSELEWGERGIEVMLPQPFHIRGTVSAPHERIATTISIARPSVIPGRGTVSRSQPLGLVGSNDLAVSYDFEFRRGGEFSVQVIPQNIESAAPVLIDAEIDDSTTLNIPIGIPQLTVDGTVLDEEGNPVINATIWAMDTSTGIVSTACDTDEEGHFSIWFAQEPKELNVIIGPSENKVTVPAVAFRLGEAYFTEGDYDAGTHVLSLATLEIPALPAPVVYSTRVVGVSSSGLNEPVAGARVIFYAQVGGGTLDDGVYVAEGTTDASGDLSLQLIPGEQGLNRTYSVIIVPPLDSPYGFMTMTTEVGPVSGVGPEIQLEERPVLVGRVSSPWGGALEDVLVSAVPRDVTGIQAYLLSDYQPSVRSGSDGSFALPLNVGTYDVTFRHDLYPAMRIEGVDVPAASSLEVAMPDKGAIPVTVLDENGLPIEGVEVRIYQVPDGCAEGSECDRTALLLYSSTTDQNGTANVLVPAPDTE